MTTIRMIATDLDDTLLSSRGEISERSRKALCAAMDRGVWVVLASGRMVPAMTRFADQVGVNAPMIAYNGAATYDAQKKRFVHVLPVAAEDAREVARMAEREGIYCQVFLGDGYFYPEVNDRNTRYAGKIGVNGVAVGMKVSEYIQEDAKKLLLIDEPERITAIAPAFQAAFQGRVNCMISRPDYLECVAPEADKANALSALAKQMGIAPDEILAFGDAQNDLQMLSFVGHGYAMANARPEVLKGIHRHAASNDDDGVAQVIEKYISEGLI